jgi:predicted GNAT family acetyltransferase
MAELDPLERPVWASLTSRQAHLALTHGRARRFDPAIGVFAAMPDWSDESVADLKALVARHGEVGIVEPAMPPPIDGLAATPQGLCCQMVAEVEVPLPVPAFAYEALTDADALQMLALATLTRPGPFFARTHTLGDFIGVKADGRLVAMAGERMRLDGHTEVSGVCTHPDHRGRAYAAGLTAVVMERIRRRGEVPFLHVYAGNTTAIRLYETLGFRIRRELEYVLLG